MYRRDFILYYVYIISMDILQKEVNRFGVENTLRQLKDYHSSLRVKKTKQFRFLNRQTMKFGMQFDVAATINRRKFHLSDKLDKHLVRLNKHYQRNPTDNMRSYIKSKIMPEYIQNDTPVISKLLNSVYNRVGGAEVGGAEVAVNFIRASNEIYDIFHTNPDVIRSSVALADSFFTMKGIATSSDKTLMAGALLLQLVLMGARSTPEGFGADNLVVDIKKEKGKQKQAAQQAAAKKAAQQAAKPKVVQPVTPKELTADEKAMNALQELNFSDEEW